MAGTFKSPTSITENQTKCSDAGDFQRKMVTRNEQSAWNRTQGGRQRTPIDSLVRISYALPLQPKKINYHLKV